jgi:Flp pilus assembly pilin Flp
MNFQTHVCRRFIRETTGQDLIEYAVLTGIVAALSLGIFTSIQTKMANAYVTWSNQIQTNWEPAPPGP